MKHLSIKLLSLIVSAAAVISFTACGCDNSSSGTDNTSSAEQTQTTTAATAVTETDISALHTFDAENGDDFAGAWQITDGTGSQYESFVFLFDGHGSADLIVGNMGYCGKYTFGTGEAGTETEGKDLFDCHLMFGINGTYTYEINDEKAVLTDIDTGETTTISKVISFDCIPIPDENPVVDEALFGAWLSDNGEYYYFDKNGIMYQNQFSTMFIYAAYSAKDGKLTATYLMNEENTDEYNYSVEGDTLTLDEYTYTRISADELE